MHLIMIFHSCDVVYMVQFYPWFKCYYPLFQMNLHLFNIFEKKKKENLMQTKEKIDGKVPLTVF